MDNGLFLFNLGVSNASGPLLSGIQIKVEPGEIVGLVGPSGAGKSLTAKAMLGMIDFKPGIQQIHLVVRGQEHSFELNKEQNNPRKPLDESLYQPLRGRLVGLLPQNPQSSLDPFLKIRRQLLGVMALSPDGGGEDSSARQPEYWLRRAGFDDPEAVLEKYAHELSGGMAQRVALAILLARRSPFLIFDEPTTGQDPIQQQRLLTNLQEISREGVGILLITHDLRILSDVAKRVIFMDKGRCIETIAADEIWTSGFQSESGKSMVENTRTIWAGGNG